MLGVVHRKLRILCLHGHHQSAATFRQKTGGFRKGIHAHAEFVFMDSPVQEGCQADEPATEEKQTWFTTSPERTYWREELTGIFDGSFEKSAEAVKDFVKNEVIPNDESNKLAGVFTEPSAVVKYYDCGHCIPPIKLCKQDIIEFFRDIQEDILRQEIEKQRMPISEQNVNR